MIVEGDREGQSDGCDAVVAVVAGVGNAGHDGAAAGGNRIIVRHARVHWRMRKCCRPGRDASAPIHAKGGAILRRWKLGIDRRGEGDDDA